jgi:hypothetical protein
MGGNQKPNNSQTRDTDSLLHNRWWVDQGKPREQHRTELRQNESVAGASFFRVAAGYDQETARSHLTDLNLKLLEEGNPPAQGWGYLRMTPDRFSARTLEKIKRAVPLPPGVRALAVDSGVSLRVILTGDPPGERLLELRFGEESSFDAWVRGEWVGEAVFERLADALQASPAFVAEYLGSPAVIPSN